MFSVGSVIVDCKCSYCGREESVGMPSGNTWQKIECPNCGQKTLGKKMIDFPKNIEIEIVKPRKNDHD